MARPLTTLLRRCEDDAAAITAMIDAIDQAAPVATLIAQFEALDSRYRGMRQRWKGVRERQERQAERFAGHCGTGE